MDFSQCFLMFKNKFFLSRRDTYALMLLKRIYFIREGNCNHSAVAVPLENSNQVFTLHREACGK